MLIPVPDEILKKVDEICAEHQYKPGLIDGFHAAEIAVKTLVWDVRVQKSQ